MNSFLTSLSRTTRRLLRAPLFTVIALVTLAVGIGANTAIFSVVYGVLLKPLPFADPERLVGVWHTAPGLGFPLLNQGPATYLTYREEGRVFEDIGLWDNTDVTITGVGEPERVAGMRVTDGTLPILGVRAIRGRTFTRQDDSPGTPETVMLTYGYWQRKFGGNPNTVGQHLTVDGTSCEIVGVLPQDFKFLQVKPDVLLPFRWNRAEVFVGNFSYQGVARLKPGVTLVQANADIARMIPHVMEKFPLPPGFTAKMFGEARLGPNVRPLSMDVIGDVGPMLWLLLGTVGMVLLIACANVANLFLVRAEARQQEFAVRAALGASWLRLARDLLAESIGLALVGGLIGVGFAYAGLRLLVALAPAGLPRLDEIGINPLVLLFTFAVSIVSGVLFGILPVVKFATPRVAALGDGGRTSSSGRERHRARSVLVVVEVALALVLLIASGLMVRTFQAMRQVDPGFTHPESVLTIRVSVPEALVKDPVQVMQTHEQIQQRIAQLPGVTSVGPSSSITMDGNDSNDPIFVEDFPGPGGRIPPIRRFKWVGERFFATMGRPVLFGRALTWADAYTMAPVVVVSENFAREYWKNPAAAIGRRIRESPQNPWRQIVGVVGDERDDGVAQKAPTVIYWPLMVKGFWDQPVFARRTLAYAIRSERMKSATFLEEIQKAVWAVNPSLPVADVRTLDEIRARSMAQTSFVLVMLSIAAAVALLLGIVGIYGVIACIAAGRTREIGIRMALGAEPGHVSRLFVRYGLVMTGIGLAVGLAAAVGLTRLMSALLFGVGPMDPGTYAAVAGLLGAVALVASYLPARRASRVDPVHALRFDA